MVVVFATQDFLQRSVAKGMVPGRVIQFHANFAHICTHISIYVCENLDLAVNGEFVL